ncbi:MAG: hypothetical protein MJZ95_01725, partial [Paludibacteraceae bacterium]|nr:hypothetical protein [Paludibacteraceae bacterium]
MKKIILLCIFMMLCISSYAQSDVYEPVAINSNDLNGDVVMGANGYSPHSHGIQISGLDQYTCFYSNNCPNVTNTNDLAHGLPSSTNAPNGAGVNIPFYFTWTGNGLFNGNDAIHLHFCDMSVTVNLQKESYYNELYFLATLGGERGSGTITVTATYTDNTTDVGNFTVNNWYYGGSKPANALQGYYRWKYNPNGVDHSDKGPCLYCYSFNGSLNQTKLIKSLTFSQSDDQMFTAIFAITGVKHTCVPNPPQNLSGTHTSNSTTITFDEATDQSGSTLTNASYVYDVARDPNFKSIVTGHYDQPFSNTTVANGRVSGTINSDLSGFYFRVRAVNNCGTSQNSATFAEQGAAIYTVNIPDVSNCSVEGCLSGSRYKSGEKITLTASVFEEGKIFGYWVDGNNNQLSTDNPYTHTVTQNITIKPVLIDEPRTFSIAEGITATMGTANKVRPWYRTTNKPGLAYQSAMNHNPDQESRDTLIITPNAGFEYILSFDFEVCYLRCYDSATVWINGNKVIYRKKITESTTTYSYKSGNSYINQPTTIVMSYKKHSGTCYNSQESGDKKAYIYNIAVTSRSRLAPAKPVLTLCSHTSSATIVTFNEVTKDIDGNTVAGPLTYKYDLAHDSCFTEIIPGHEDQPLNVTTSGGVSTGTINENLSGLYVRIRAINVNGTSYNSNAIADNNPDVYVYKVVVPASSRYVLSGYKPEARYKAGESVTLSASLTRRGMEFKGWADENDNTLSTDNPYTHTFPQTATGSGIQHVTLKPILELEVREYAIAPGVTARMGTLDKDLAWIRYYDGEASGLAYISAVNFRSAVSRDTLVITPDQGVAYALSFECKLHDDNTGDDLKIHVNDSTLDTSIPSFVSGNPDITLRREYNSGDKNFFTEPTTIIMAYTKNNYDYRENNRCFIYNLKVSVPYTVTAKSNNPDMGSVTGGGYYLGTQEVTLTATPESGYRFKGWSDGSKANPYKLTVDRDTDITAIFDIDHLSMPLCFTAKGGGNVNVRFDIKNVQHTIQYSTDKVNWETYTSNTAVTLANDGDKVYFRAAADQTNASTFGTNNKFSQFFFTSDNGGKVEASGNIMSLYGPS